MIYLDYAATTPISDEALDVYVKVSKKFFGNTMSLHDIGTEANDLLEHCRRQLATTINGETEGLVFTSGGSESNLLAIYGHAMACKEKGNHILVAEGAHGSVKSALGQLEQQGFLVERVSPDGNGHVGIEQLAPLLKEETCLVITSHVNGEFGFIEPIKELGAFLDDKGVRFHVDAVQGFGKLPIDVKKSRLSSISFSSHKIYGPKGVGGLYIDPSLSFVPLLPFGTHENGRRQGTVNLPGIAAFTEAAIRAMADREKNYQTVLDIKRYMINEMRERDLPIVIESPLEETSPYILAMRVPGTEGQFVMLEANRKGVAISTGSACSVHQQKPSSILMSMGRSVDEAREVVRFSFGNRSTKEHINQAIEVLASLS
ncbi:IscS subfamily cysteine desulfurase [Pullulanibacillus sp. KACC 23026]|uniref:IscS subfamily cysteine desulfurase n=1 Tax=Pullulanibacillus sp. KACC 23026 TaxID=3028315 RepID=UPI0023B0624D|nr:IscS subfamily cysteine desulfurase [Pullulanibacillus sp. KACC 23026]WEG12339.1 IscS subfamily cysteine desulfurase [Pullulanibacillus sp. KACC 23026]